MEIFIIMLFIIGVATIYMLREAFANNVVRHHLRYEDFPESFGEVTFFFISDIHRRTISDSIIEQVKKEADLVIIGGDLTEKGVPFKRVKSNLMKLKEIGPVYFVWGNNDYEVDFRELDALLLSSGIKVLDNTAVYFESKTGDSLSVVGIDDLTKGRPNVELALQDAEKADFKVLVSHNPEITNKITEGQNVRLILSGHTHGGQIRIFGFGLYEKGRLKQKEHYSILISNGYGTTGVPLRLGAKAEVHLVKISKTK